MCTATSKTSLELDYLFVVNWVNIVLRSSG
ncbi:protein of unknown function [Candidatus Filomicrobium marinum]|uniref:Uncharacterized protein n=1 Tax=Candidatus Filomicrobium marinum TaxID=1608628 RepID=A0A0D6JF80_9HYPH|nr:protein of unknown function [Candidatus Filomicrobium marinum]CPR18464.1 protein of unknown function [Candidatus Filomicrobium marinum]